MDWPYTWSFVALCVVQAVAIAVPRQAPDWPWIGRHAVLGLMPLAAIGGGVLILARVPDAAQRATDLAAVATPLLALGGALAFRVRALATLAPLAYVVAWQAPGTRAADAGIDALIVGACATLAWLTGAVAPRWALCVGIVVATITDVVLIVTRDIQPVARALSAADPAAGLPRLQEAVWRGASMGWGDVYLAAILGVVVAHSLRLVAIAVGVNLVAHLAWGFAFEIWDVIPATVPTAVALLAVGVVERSALRGWLARARYPAPTKEDDPDGHQHHP